LLTSNGASTYLEGNASTSAVTLYHASNSPRLATTSTGIDVTGIVTATGNITAGSSTAGVVTVGSANGFEIQKSGVNGYINQSDNGPIIIRMGSSYSEKIRIDASGNVLVGTTSAYGTTGTTINQAGLVYSSADGDRAGQFDRTTSDGEIVRFSKAGTTVGSIGADGVNLTINSASTGHLQTVGTSRYYWDDAQLYPANTNSKNLGHPSYQFKDAYLSGGVYLGGTGAANKLDDYEEGTWTPVINDGTYGYSHRRGHYVKIGNMVYIHVGLRINTASSVTGANASISGLPFLSLNYGGYQEPHARVAVAGLCVTANLSSNLSFFVSNNGTDLNARTSANNTDAGVNANALWQNGTFIKLMIIYTTNA
jgi:hypothetical protein